MSLKMKHKLPVKTYYFFINKDDKEIGLHFKHELDPYSGSMVGGSRVPFTITSSKIFLTESVEKVTQVSKISDFINWVNDAKPLFEKFMTENELEIKDIKVRKVEYIAPIETEINPLLDEFL